MVGAAVWLATIGASASVNYLAGYEFGRNPVEGHVLALIGLAGDAWKAAGPIFAITLWRGRRKTLAIVAAMVWMVCFTFAVCAALGLAARTRNTALSNQETLAAQYQEAQAQIQNLEVRLADLGGARSVSERNAAIDVALAKPVNGGTVANVSENCKKDVLRTRAACEEITKLKRELVAAEEASKLEDRIARLKESVDELRHRGATRESDAQAKLISTLSFGILRVEEIGLALSLVLVAMVELISAFAPAIVHEFLQCADTPARGAASKPSKGLIREGSLLEYLADRVAPDPGNSMKFGDLVSDYIRWCERLDLNARSRARLRAELEKTVGGELAGHVSFNGRIVRGLRLRDEALTS